MRAQRIAQEVHLRPATTKDSERISELYHELNGYHVSLGVNRISLVLARRFARQVLEHPVMHVHVAEADRVVGFVSFSIRGAVCLGGLLLVTEAWRGRGVGLQLMHLFEEQGREAGATLARIDVMAENGASLALFERLGYLREGTSSPYLAPRIRIATLSKEIGR